MSSQAKVVWLSGNLHDRKLVLGKIKDQFAHADYTKLDGDYSVAYLEQLIFQSSVFDSEKLIVIYSLPKPTSTRQTMVNQLKKLLDRVPDNCLVVFDGIPASSEKAISGHVAKIGRLYEYASKLEPREAPSWLSGVFKELGKDISVEDASYLIETSGHDKGEGGVGADVLRIAAEKIALYMGRRKSVTREDVQANVFPSQDFVIWSLHEALDSKDLTACHNAFAKLAEQEQSVVAAVNILYNISLPRYRMLMFLKESISNGKSKQQAHAEAMQMLKLSQSGKAWEMKLSPDMNESGVNAGHPKSAWSDFAVNSALYGSHGRPATVDQYSRKELVRIVAALEGGLPELRARSASPSAMSLLADSLFLSACSGLDDTTLEELRKPYGYTQ